MDVVKSSAAVAVTTDRDVRTTHPAGKKQKVDKPQAATAGGAEGGDAAGTAVAGDSRGGDESQPRKLEWPALLLVAGLTYVGGVFAQVVADEIYYIGDIEFALAHPCLAVVKGSEACIRSVAYFDDQPAAGSDLADKSLYAAYKYRGLLPAMTPARDRAGDPDEKDESHCRGRGRAMAVQQYKMAKNQVLKEPTYAAELYKRESRLELLQATVYSCLLGALFAVVGVLRREYRPRRRRVVVGVALGTAVLVWLTVWRAGFGPGWALIPAAAAAMLPLVVGAWNKWRDHASKLRRASLWTYFVAFLGLAAAAAQLAWHLDATDFSRRVLGYGLVLRENKKADVGSISSPP